MLRCARYTLLTIAAMALVAVAQPAQGQEVIDLGSGFACEGNRALGDHTSTAGDTLTVVGYVVNFNDPFGDLDANDPDKEYTYIYSELVSNGTTVSSFPSGADSICIYETTYTGGTLQIFCDDGQDGDYGNKGTFANGELILSFSLEGLTTSTFTRKISPSFFELDLCTGNTEPEDLTVTGGSYGDRLSECPIVQTNAGTVIVCTDIDTEVPDGYFGKIDTKIDAECPVPVDPRSWGELKRGDF